MAKKPKKSKPIKILGQYYRVSRRRYPNDGMLHYGNCDHLTGVIGLNRDSRPSQAEQTLLHEIVHVIDSELCLNLSEKQVTQLSAGLYAVLKDNPKIL